MVIAEVLFAGGWQTAHSFSLPNRLMPTFGVRRRVFDDESHHPIDLGERFLRRRISGYFEDRLFRMATGPIRLAQMLDAELVPVLIVETSTWKYTIHFGSPVPQHHLGCPPDMQAIGTHLLQEFSKVITRHPEQCNMRLLRAMCPLPENGVADLSAVVQAAENP